MAGLGVSDTAQHLSCDFTSISEGWAACHFKAKTLQKCKQCKKKFKYVVKRSIGSFKKRLKNSIFFTVILQTVLNAAEELKF